MKKKIALISVSDKAGLETLVKALDSSGFEIVSTGGTAKAIEKAGVKVTPVEKITEFREMLDGRVKTLHPKLHAGILALRDNKSHMQQLKEANITLIDLVVVNLYPFRKVVEADSSLEEIIENIDIGGPSLLRAAAKNFESVAVVTSPLQYKAIVEELEKEKALSLETRKRLASAAFELSAAYDSIISRFLHNRFLSAEIFPKSLTPTFEKSFELRYGENWHQKAAFYKQPLGAAAGIADTEQLHGKELSFNNVNDASAAVELVKEFSEPTAVIIKHANPCGVASCKDISTAFGKALECDNLSAFGSIIALNRECDSETAAQISSFFNEVVIAPGFGEIALETLKKKKNLRILKLSGLGEQHSAPGLELRTVGTGLLAQTPDSILLDKAGFKTVSKRKPSKEEEQDLLFAWAVAKHAKSNAIVLAKDSATIGIGAGQMSRIDAIEIAIKKSNGRHKGSVLASDAFLPFRDNVATAAKAGITAIIHPGGSVKDEEVIKAADEHNIAMLFTGVRHFRH